MKPLIKRIDEKIEEYFKDCEEHDEEESSAEDVTNEVTDVNNLSDIAIETKEVLEADELDVVADMGYYNGSEVKKCMEQSITPYIEKPNTSANTKRGLYGKEKFLYNSERDCYICLAGEELTYRFDTVERGCHIRYYTTYACRKCSLKPKCTRNKEGRRITRWIHEDILEEIQKRVEQNKQAVKKRKYIVEHPFGTIKRWMNQGYFLTRGLEKANVEFNLTVMVYNMKRAMNIIGVKDMIKALI